MLDGGHIHEDDLQLYAHGTLSLERVLELDAHLQSCPGCVAKLEDAAVFAARSGELRRDLEEARRERRTESRIPSNVPGSLQVLQPLSFLRDTVRVTDTSHDGLGLELPSHVDTGALVQIRVEDSIVLGEVRYCVRAEEGYRAGIRVEDVHRTPTRR